MRTRVMVLPLAAAIIAGMAVWRTHWETQRRSRPRVAVAPLERRLAPRFVLYDQNGTLVKFERYLGRTRLLILFTGAETALDHIAALSAIADNHAALEAQEIQVLAITLATPFAVRSIQKERGRPYPFPVLTDIETREQHVTPMPAHQAWCRVDSGGAALEGLFLVDRAGQVAYEHDVPKPVQDSGAAIRQLVAGEWPQ